MAARRSAYGDEYATKIKCPECGVESNIEIDLSVLKTKPLNTEGLTKGENRQ
ncbi:MAG: hypothetical protein ACO21N_02090 [Candidatus Nanopelagicales bacterium]